MRTIYKISSIILFAFLTSCMATKSVQVMKPAPITIKQNIQSVAIVNRTLPQTQAGNILEGLLTGEMPGQDKKGVSRTLEGLHSTLQESTRFNVVSTNEELLGSGTGGTFPAPLPWSKIEELCRKYNVDGIIALETYDSDFIVTNAKKEKVITESNGQKKTANVFTAKGVASVKLGFRFYDPSIKSIIDQQHFSDNKTWQAEGTSVADAALHLIGRGQAVQEVSNISGINYAQKLVPLYYNVNRTYFKKHKKNIDMKAAARKAQINDWEGASEIWKRLSNDSDRKLAGKATYNLALASEMEGELDNALKYAKDSYGNYNIKQGRTYSNTLQRRKYEVEKLKEQMGD